MTALLQPMTVGGSSGGSLIVSLMLIEKRRHQPERKLTGLFGRIMNLKHRHDVEFRIAGACLDTFYLPDCGCIIRR